MADFLHLCFSWPMWIACGLIAILAFGDIFYGADKYLFVYPHHPGVQFAVMIFGPIIFVLWQLSPEFSLLENGVLVLVVRLISFVVWYIIARVLIYLAIIGFAYYLHWSILGKLP